LKATVYLLTYNGVL